MSTPESKVRDPVVKWAKANNFLHHRMAFMSGTVQGWPDDLFISPNGTHVWVEFKAPGRKPTALQMSRIDLLLRHHALAFWADSKEAAIEALQRLLGAEATLNEFGGRLQ